MPGSNHHDRAFATPRDLRSKLTMWFGEDHVCVLTIGKTASSAIIQGVIDAGVPAFQAHSLCRSPQAYLFVDGLPPQPLRNRLYRAKVGTWLALTRNRPKKFITTFRDPFARNMSAFFEQSWKLGGDVSDLSTEELVALYDRHGPHDATRLWFKQNLTDPFAIDVGSLNLIRNTTQEIGANRRRFLFMKYERQDAWEQALSAFCGARVTLRPVNVSARKPYSDAFERLRSAWRPSREIVRRTLDVDLWNAIYSDTEKATILERWDIDDRDLCR